MVQSLDINVDVTGALGFGKSAHIAVTVTLPNPQLLPKRPIICFAKPGGGYSRCYYTMDLPGPTRGAQATFHSSQDWIFVAVDVLGSGGSSRHEADELTFATLTLAANEAEKEILDKLANGVLVPGYPPVPDPVTIGLGHASGASVTVVQQARHNCFDAVALLGCSGFHNHPPTRPGDPPLITPWFTRDAADEDGYVPVNAAVMSGHSEAAPQASEWMTLAWAFYYDDVGVDVVQQDLGHFDLLSGAVQPTDDGILPWHSLGVAERVNRCIFTPGSVAAEAAAIRVPVFSAIGERDIIVDPPGEARIFSSAPSFDFFVCPRMGHMHNFAGTRTLLWERLHHFGSWARSWHMHSRP